MISLIAALNPRACKGFAFVKAAVLRYVLNGSEDEGLVPLLGIPVKQQTFSGPSAVAMDAM
jgi:hypothetical protein